MAPFRAKFWDKGVAVVLRLLMISEKVISSFRAFFRELKTQLSKSPQQKMPMHSFNNFFMSLSGLMVMKLIRKIIDMYTTAIRVLIGVTKKLED